MKLDPLENNSPFFKIRSAGDPWVDPFERKPAFGGRFVMAFQAILLEERDDLVLKLLFLRRNRLNQKPNQNDNRKAVF